MLVFIAHRLFKAGVDVSHYFFVPNSNEEHQEQMQGVEFSS